MDPRSEIHDFMVKRIGQRVELWSIVGFYEACGVIDRVEYVNGVPTMFVRFASGEEIGITNEMAGHVMFVVETEIDDTLEIVTYRPGQEENTAA